MYEQVEKPKDNKNRAVANAVAQKKNNAKKTIGFVDNRAAPITQKKQDDLFRSYDNNLSTLQKKDRVTGKTGGNSGVKFDSNEYVQFKSMDNHGLSNIDYTTMNSDTYLKWSKTSENQGSMHGVYQLKNTVVVTRYNNPDEVAQLVSLLSSNQKAGLLALEGGLSIAAGIALTATGVGVLPGIAAIVAGSIKLVRAFVVYYSAKVDDASKKNLEKFADILRGLEACAAIASALTGNPAAIVFAIAKLIRSFATAAANNTDGDMNPVRKLTLKKLAAVMHWIEVFSGAAGAISAPIPGVAVAGVLIAGSKFKRSHDQTGDVTGWNDEFAHR